MQTISNIFLCLFLKFLKNISKNHFWLKGCPEIGYETHRTTTNIDPKQGEEGTLDTGGDSAGFVLFAFQETIGMLLNTIIAK